MDHTKNNLNSMAANTVLSMNMKQHQKDPEALKYKRQFWRLAARHLPHHSMLVISAKLKTKKLTAALSERRDSVLQQSVVKMYPPERVDEYKKVIATTKIWHGTGRLQHKDTEIIDAFEAILSDGALRPVRDVYAILLDGNEMVSISTTALRIIARSYADMHGKGERERYRYGSSLWWVAYYYSLFYGIIFTRYNLTVMRNMAKWNAASRDEAGVRSWGQKVNHKAQSVWSAFGQGSDIDNNYPILFGIKRYTEVAKLPKAIEKVEVRLLEPVHIDDLSHIEVPEDKVGEVQNLLAKHGFSTPVFPIELGEYVASRQSFAALLGIK